MADAPERIRVAQDADGFWTCREAVSDSQEYVRADLYAALEVQLAEAKEDAVGWSLEASRYAERLLIALMEKHYPDRSPEWAPLPDLMGILTQIDNLTAGLVRATPTAEAARRVLEGGKSDG